MKKRLLSILLCLCMALSLLPTTALAEGTHRITLSSDTISATESDPSCGSVTLSTVSAAESTTVTVTVTANATHTVAGVEATYTAGEGDTQLIEPTDKKDGTWTFAMPDYDVEVNVTFSARLNTMTLGGEDKFVTVGYATAPTLTVTGAPEGASFIWYRGEDLTDKSAIIGGAGGSSYTVPSGLGEGAHKYTAYVSAANYEAAQCVFTVTVNPVTEVSVGDVTDPASPGGAYTAPVRIGSDSDPVNVAVAIDTTNTASPSAELTWPVGSGSPVSVQVSAVGNNAAELSATFTLPGSSSGAYSVENPYAVDESAADALLAALDGSAQVANAVFDAANNTTGQSYIPEAAAPALVFAAPASANTAAVTLDDSLVTGLAARDISVAALTGDHRISLGGDSLSAVASEYTGRNLVMAVAADNTLTSDIFTGVTGAALIPNSGVEFTLEAVDPTDPADSLPVAIPGGIDIALTLPAGTDTERFNETGGLVHQTGGGTTEVIPADIGSSFAGASVDLSGYGFTKENGKWHNSISGEAGRLCYRSGSNGETLTFYCDADGYVRRGWTNGFLFQQTPPTQAATWLYVRADGVETNGIAIVDGQTYWFSDGNIHSGRMFTMGGESFCTDGAGTLREGLIAKGRISFYALANFRLHSGNSWYKIGESYYQFAGLAVIDQQTNAPSVWHAIPTVQPAVYASISSCSPVAAAYLSWQDAADTSWYDDGENHFTLYTAAELAGLAKLVNEGKDFSDKTVALAESIDLSGANWTPIGGEDHPFRGTFYGGGSTVSNMTIASASDKYAALFGECEDARITYLTVSGSVTGGANYAAGIVAMAEATHIENCHSAVEIDVTGDGVADYHAGGIAAYMLGASLKTFVGCSNTGNISVANAGRAHVGGIVGDLRRDRVYNSYNTGDISASASSDPFAGGIAGAIYQYSDGTAYIANCYSMGTATSTVTEAQNGAVASSYMLAGLIPNDSVIINCYGYSDSTGSGGYHPADGTAIAKTAADLKALLGTLNAWVSSPTVTLDTTTETPFAPWYVSAQYNDGYPCFTQYIAPPDPGPSYDYYTITAFAGAHGAISPEGRVSVRERRDKSFVIAPDEGYRVYDVLVDGESVGAVTEYTFEGVRADHTISARFAQVFSDVNGEWFAGDVDHASAMGLMEGTGGRLFSPYLDTTRGMIVTILWRVEGEPEATEPMSFTDVPAEKYYHDAVAWAAEHEIVLGYNETAFGPEDPITREQLAAILWRYARYKGHDVAGGTDAALLGYADAGAVTAYAVPAMRWACASGLIRGDGGRLTPQGRAARCQTAAILHRLCAVIQK